MAATLPIGIIFLTRRELEYCDSSLSRIAKLGFVQTMVKDLEVLNKEQFDGQIKMFIQQNNIPLVNLVIVLSDSVLFEKDIPMSQNAQDSNQEDDAQTFIDIIPFENTASKIYQFESGLRVIATNRDFYETVSTAFEAQGFPTVAVLPAFVFGKPIETLDLETCQQIITKYDSLRQYSLLFDGTSTQQSHREEQKKNELSKKITPKFLTYIGIFIILIIVFIILYIMNR